MQNTFIGLLLATGILSSGCASNRQELIGLGTFGAAAMVGGGYVFNEEDHCSDCGFELAPDPSQTVAGGVLFAAGAAALGYMTYELITKDKAWLDAPRGTDPTGAVTASESRHPPSLIVREPTRLQLSLR